MDLRCAANTGDTTLIVAPLVDDRLSGPVSACGPVTLPSTLAVAGVLTCTATGIATLGQYANMGTVTGTPPYGPPVTDTNPSHYYGFTPAIELIKYTNGYDADDPDRAVHPGGQPGDVDVCGPQHGQPDPDGGAAGG